MKSSVKLSALLLVLLLASCTASYAAPKRPWRVEIKTDGGFIGKGIGTYALNSDGKATVTPISGRECTFDMDVAPIEKILAHAKPREWKDSYVPEDPCCDRVHYALTYDEAGVKTVTEWIDSPLPMPKDLVELSRAIVGGDPTSVRMMASERCR